MKKSSALKADLSAVASQSEAKAEIATCQLCGAKIEPDAAQLAAHLFLYHPREYFESAAGRNTLKYFSDQLYTFGRNLSAALFGGKS